MKLSPTLSKFLAANKQLSLPGIGTFYSEGAYSDPEGKRSALLTNVTFNHEKVNSFSPELIDFISQETGKMKILAESDLSSQLEDALQYINTGKPYFFNGIGTLTKKQTGQFDFHPEKFSQSTERKKEREAPITETNHVPQSYIDPSRTGRRSLKPILAIITLSLIAIAVCFWFYFKNQDSARQSNLNSQPGASDNIAVTVDSTANSSNGALPAQASNAPANSYTYVLEEAKEPRASKRFNQLKSIKWPVELETIDSLNKRIVMKLPAAGADTSRIKDSLRVLSGKPVYIVR